MLKLCLDKALEGACWPSKNSAGEYIKCNCLDDRGLVLGLVPQPYLVW